MAVVRMDPKRRRVHNVEEDWFALLAELGPSALRRGFIGAGVSPQVAAGLTFFIEDQAALAPHAHSHSTRSRYRAVLRSLSQAEVEVKARTIPGLFNRARRAA